MEAMGLTCLVLSLVMLVALLDLNKRVDSLEQNQTKEIEEDDLGS